MKSALRPVLAALGISAAASFVAGPATAASFDCAAARAPDEIAICSDRSLSEMDTEMGALWYAYSRVPMLMGSNGARRDEAHDFLAKRASCGADTACLNQAYGERIAVLKNEIVQAMQDVNAQENATPGCPPRN